MPRRMDLKLPNGKSINCYLQKFSWENQYGIRGRSYLSLGGKPLKIVKITGDGKHIIPQKAISQMYIDELGKEVVKSELISTDRDGNPLSLTRSMFDKEGAPITGIIPIDNYFCYDIVATYILESDEEGGKDKLSTLYEECEILFNQGELFKLTYAYYPTSDPSDAILIPTIDKKIIVAVGKFAEPFFSGPETNIDLLEIAELEEQTIDQFDFEKNW